MLTDLDTCRSGYSSADADPELPRAQCDLDLIVLAGVVAVEPLIDEQSSTAEVGLARNQSLQLGDFVVEALGLMRSSIV